MKTKKATKEQAYFNTKKTSTELYLPLKMNKINDTIIKKM